EENRSHDEELLRTEKPADEVHETHGDEIEQKPSGADVRIESPHESDHEEEEEEGRYQSERKPTDDQVVLQSSPTIEEDQYKASSILAAVPIAFGQEIYELKHEPEEYYQIKRKLSTEQVTSGSSELSEYEQEEDQYEPEVITSSDKIRIESAEAAEDNLEEPLAAAVPQLIEPVKLDTTYTDEEKDHYETEEKLTTVEKVLESTETVTEEGKRSHDEELLRTEKPAGEVHETHEDEIEQKPTGTDIRIESPHESDHEEEEEEEGRYQRERKPSDGQIVLESSQIIEHAQYEPSSGFAATPIAFHQEVHEVKREPEEFYQIKRKLSAEQVTSGSSELSEHELDEDQYESEMITSSEKIEIEPSQIIEEHGHEELLSSDRELIESPELRTAYAEEKEGHAESEVKSTPGQNVFEYSRKVDGEETFHEKEPPEREATAGETPELYEYNIEEKSKVSMIHLESPHEEELAQLERKGSAGQIVLESEEKLEEDQYERASNFEQVPVVFHEQIHDVKQESKEDYQIERKLSAEQVTSGSSELSEHEQEEDQYEPESMTSSDGIKIERSEPVEQDRHQPLSTVAQHFIEPAELVTAHTETRKDHYASEEESTADKNVIESSETEKEEERHYAQEPSKFETEVGETYERDKYEIERKSTGADVQIESSHESDHEEEEEEQYQPQRKLSEDQVVLESSGITEEAQYELSSILAAVPIAFHQEIPKVKHEPEEDHQIERKLSTEQVIVESPQLSEHEQEEDQYEREPITSSDKIQIRPTEAVEEDQHKLLLASAQDFIEPAQLVTAYSDEQKDEYESEEELSSDKKVIESSEIIDEEKTQHDEELSETEKPAREIHARDEYVIEQKSTDVDISSESLRESDREEEEEQQVPEEICGTDEVIVETPDIIEHEKSQFERYYSDEQTKIVPREDIELEESEAVDQHELHERLCSQKTELEFLQFSESEDEEDEFQQSPRDQTAYFVSSQETRPQEIEVKDQYQSERKLSSEKTIIESTQRIEHEEEQKDYERPLSPEQVFDEEKEEPERKLSLEKRITEFSDLREQEEDQYEQKFESESISSSEKIKIEPTETAAQDRHEPLLTSQEQFIKYPEVEIQQKDEKEDHYEPEEKLTIDTNIIGSPQTPEKQEKHADKELFETEKETFETHEEDEYEIEQKSSSADIHSESSHESDHEQEKEQYEPSSSFEAVSIALPQKSEEVKQESEEDYQIEQNLSTEHDITGFSELSEHEQEEDQYESKYETRQYQSPSMISQDKMEIETVEIAEQDHFEPLETSTQQYIRFPEVSILHVGDQKDQHEDKQQLATGEITIESPEAREEEKRHHDQESLQFETEAGETHEEDEYELERKLSDENIHLESPHEIDHKEEQEKQVPERKLTADQVVIESTEKFEQDQYEPTLSLEHVLNQYHQVIEKEKQELEEIDEMQRILTSEQVITGSVALYKQEQEEDQYEQKYETEPYEPESLSSSEKISIESPVTLEEDRLESLESSAQQFVKPSDIDTQHMGEEKLIRDEIIIESPRKVEEEEYHDEQPWKHEKPFGETRQLEEYEIEQKSTISDVHLESPPESDHEQEQVQPERKRSVDQVIVESSGENEEDQYKPTLIFEHILNQYHEVIQKEEQGLEEINEIQRMLTTIKNITGSEEVHEQKQEEVIYEPRLSTSSDNIKIEPPVPQEKEDEKPLQISQPRFFEPLEVDTLQTHEEKYHYEPEEKLTTDEFVLQSPKTVKEQEKHDDEEPFETEREASEIHESYKYEIEQKPTGVDIHVESPHESDHEEEEEEQQYQPERKHSDEQAILESSSITEQPQYELSSILTTIPVVFHQEIQEVKHEPEEDYQIERKLSTEQVTVASPQFSEHEQEEDQYESESLTSSDKIQSKPTVTFEQDRHEALLTFDRELIESPELRTSYSDEKEDQDEFEEKLTTDKIVIESPEIFKQEEERRHDEEQLETEKPASEVHKRDEYEIERKSTDADVQIESPHESDHEEEEEEQYQHQRKLSEDQVVLESSGITEEAQYELSSILAAVPIAFHQEIPKVKHEPEEDHQIERKLSTEQVIVESPQLSEHAQEEEQYEPESLTGSDKIQFKPTETVEQDSQESLLSSDREFIESPELRTSYLDEKQDQDESQEKLTTDKIVIESSKTFKEEQEIHHAEELLEREKTAGEVHERDEYEIEQKPSGADIHIKSPHESDQEEEEKYQPERKLSTDQVIVESEEKLEDGQFERSSSFEETPIRFRQEVEEEQEESEQSSSFEKPSIESSEASEHEDQYQPESIISSDMIKTEATQTVQQVHRIIEHPDVDTQHTDEQEDRLESKEKLTIDKSITESSEKVEEERRYHDEELFEPEKTTGEIYEIHDYEIEPKLSRRDIHVESPGESDHEEEVDEQVQPERKLSTDQFFVESPEENEEDQSERTSSFEQVDVGLSQDIEEKQHKIKDDQEQEQKLSSKPEPFETIDLKQYQQETYRTDEEIENVFKSERKLSSGKISLESSQSGEHVEESQKLQDNVVTPEIYHTESTGSIERYEEKFDTDQYSEKFEPQEEAIMIEVPQKIEDEDIESNSLALSEYENVEQQCPSDKTMIETSEKFDEDKSEQKHDDESKQKLSRVKFIVASAPSSEEEEKEGYEYGREFYIESPQKLDDDLDDENFLKMLEKKYSNQQEIQSEQKFETDEIIIQSPDTSEHEDERRTINRLVIESSQTIESDDDEQPITYHQQIEESEKIPTQFPQLSEHEDQHELISSEFDQQIKEKKLEYKSSPDQIIISSSHLIEPEKDENILKSSQIIDKEPLEKQIADEIIHESLETIKQQNAEYERPLSSEHVTLTFSQQYDDDDTYKLKSQYEFEPSLSTGKSTVEFLEENEQDDKIITQTSQKLEYPYESSQSFEREIIDEYFPNLESSSFQKEQDDDYEIEHEQLKRPQQWTQSSFQRDEIYGDKYRPTKYSNETPETEIPQTSNYKEQIEVESPITSHIQRSSIISRTIPTYSDDEEVEEQEETDFRPTHLDISIPDENLLKTSTSDQQIYEKNNQYDKVLIQTSHDIVDQILNDAIRETTEQDLNYLLYQTAKDIVHDVIDNIHRRYDDEIISSQIEEATSADVSISDITDWSALVKTTPNISHEEKSTIRTSSSSDHEQEKQQEENVKDEYIISDDDDIEEKHKFIPQTIDLPYLSVSDVVTSKSTQELGDLVHELQTLEKQINENVGILHSSSSSSSSSSSLSENDEIHHYDLNNAQITTTISTTELTNLVAELQTIEEQLEDKLDSKLEQKYDIPVSSKSLNELGDLMNELNNVTEQLNERLQQQNNEQSTNTDKLSHDIIKYRRDSQSNTSEKYSHRTERRPSSPPASPLYKREFVHVTCSSMSDVDQVQEQLQHEHEENQILHALINTIIKQAQQNIQSDSLEVPQSAPRTVPTLVVDQRRKPYIQSSATSISDELDFSHDDGTIDKTSELAAQLDYLRRMSRYENLPDQQHHIELESTGNNRTVHEDTMIQITPGDDENEIMSSNYLTIVQEEQQFSDEHEEDLDENKDKEKKKKKSKRKCAEDDDKSLSEHHDSDDDDHDHKDNKPLIPLNTTETIQYESNQQSTSTESNQKQSQQQQQMEMSHDSINELMMMSQDSLKQRSSDSLDSEQELKSLLLNPNTSIRPTNEADDFMYKQHTSEPTPSRMMMKYDEDDTNDTQPTTKQYSLISNEIEIGQLPVIHARRTASENSLFSTSSSSIHMYDSHSLSASCLVDKDDLTPSDEYIDRQQNILYDDSQKNQQIYRETTTTTTSTDNNEYNNLNTNITSSPTTGIGFFDRVKAFVTKPVEIVQEAMENRRKRRSTSSLSSNTDLNDKQILDNEQNLSSSPSSSQQQQQQQQPHFHSAYDLYDEEKLKLVRSPELYNMDNVHNFNQKLVLTNLQAQNRTQSESALVIEDMKRHSIGTASNEASEEFLPTISKDNSLEFIQQQQQQQRHSTPFDDVMEKESSSEHSESYNIPTTAFSDAFEPTSSCQRPLALTLPGQQPPPPPQQIVEESMTEEEFDTLAANYVHQVLNDVVIQMTSEHDDSLSNKSDKLVGNDTSSDDDDEDELVEGEDEEQNQHPIPTDTSSFSVNDRYSADESSNTREQSADEENSARSSITATPTKTVCHTNIYTEDLIDEQTPTALISPSIVHHSSQSDTGTYFSIVSPSSGDYVDAHSTYSTVDDDKLGPQYYTQSNSSQYLTANDETPNLLTSDDNDYHNERGKINYAYNDSSSDENYSNKNRQENFMITNEKISEEKYSGEGEESSSSNKIHIQQRRKRSNEQRSSLLNDLTTNTLESTTISQPTTTKSVSFKLDLNENFQRSPRLSTSSGIAMPRQESLDSPLNDSNDKSIIKILQEEILRSNLKTIKSDLELDFQYDKEIYPSTSTPTTMQLTKKILSSSEYDAGSESDRDSTLVDSIKTTIQEKLNDIYHDKESFIDKIKLKFERSLDRLVEKTLAGEENTNKSDIISPFTDQSLDRSLPSIVQPSTIIHAHSEQLLQACPDELDYGTLQRFSSDSCIIIHVQEQYTPSSTLFFDQLKTDQIEKKSSSNQQTSAFSYYTKQDNQQPSSSPIEMLNPTNELIENISPINRYTPRSLDDSSIELGERDMTDMSDEFVLVKNLSPPTNTKDIKNDTPSNTSSSSSEKHESPDLIDILQHQCDYPPLDTGFDLRSGTTLETVYESPELRQEEIKSAISTLSLTPSETNRPYSTERNSSNTPNTDDSLMEFERIEMELLKNTSTTNIIDIVREIRSSVESLTQQHDDNNKVEIFIEKHFTSIQNDVENVLNDILDMTNDLTHSISSQSDATTVIYKSQHHSFDDDYVEITHDDIKNQERNLFSSDEDFLHNQTTLSSHDKRRLSAPNNENISRRLKTPSSSSSSSSSFSSTSRSVIYSQQHSHPSYQQHRLLQAETDLSSFKQHQQTQSATDLPFLPPFVNTNPIKRKKQSSSVSSTPTLFPTEITSGDSKKKTHSHPGSLGGSQVPPRSSLIKEEITSSPITSVSPHSSSHHSDDCFCTDPTTTTTSHQH
ncbi:unnamed protein product, partial [Rotaria sp. Silwood2]